MPNYKRDKHFDIRQEAFIIICFYIHFKSILPRLAILCNQQLMRGPLKDHLR